MYKNKRVLMEAIHKQKAEKMREMAIAEKEESRRTRNKIAKEKKEARREKKLTEVRDHPYFDILHLSLCLAGNTYRRRGEAEEVGYAFSGRIFWISGGQRTIVM